MPFVQAKCPNCGGNLTVDNTHDAAICQFCNTPFVVEKAINNYQTTVQIQNSNVTFQSPNNIEAIGATIERLIAAGEYKDAQRLSTSLCRDFPADYHGLWYNFLISTESLTKQIEPYSCEMLLTSLDKILIMAPPEKSEELNLITLNYRNIILIPGIKQYNQHKLEEQALLEAEQAKSKKQLDLFWNTMTVLILAFCAYMVFASRQM